MTTTTNANIGFEKQIWDAACVLRGNIDASEYKSVVLGLIFLKYISDRFEAKYKELVEEGDGFEEDIDEYISENIFFVPQNARCTNFVQSQKFSEKITRLMNSYYNGLITNEEVIKELLKTAEEIAQLYKEGKKLGLTQEELAFYDALTKPENIKDFYQNEQLIALTKELTEMLRKNRTIDWQKKESARASMRKMVKRLLKKYKYPPEDYDIAITTVLNQCEMWVDNGTDAYEIYQNRDYVYEFVPKTEQLQVAESFGEYRKN